MCVSVPAIIVLRVNAIRRQQRQQQWQQWLFVIEVFIGGLLCFVAWQSEKDLCLEKKLFSVCLRMSLTFTLFLPLLSAFNG